MDRIHILATGTSRGIGTAIAARLDRPDVRFVGHSSRPGDDARIPADLDEPGAAVALWNEALERLDGRIDVLVNNAGIFEAAPIDLPDADWLAAWERTMRINLTASAELCRLAVRHFATRPGGGRIVNVASRAAYRGDSPAHWHYAASKAGMVGMSKSLAAEVASRNITVNCVAPGFITTAMTDKLNDEQKARILTQVPAGRMGEPSEIAAAVLYLASPESGYVTGATLHVNGGMAMI